MQLYRSKTTTRKSNLFIKKNFKYIIHKLNLLYYNCKTPKYNNQTTFASNHHKRNIFITSQFYFYFDSYKYKKHDEVAFVTTN